MKVLKSDFSHRIQWSFPTKFVFFSRKSFQDFWNIFLNNIFELFATYRARSYDTAAQVQKHLKLDIIQRLARAHTFHLFHETERDEHKFYIEMVQLVSYLVVATVNKYFFWQTCVTLYGSTADIRK